MLTHFILTVYVSEVKQIKNKPVFSKNSAIVLLFTLGQ